jgi:hypothetical protein
MESLFELFNDLNQYRSAVPVASRLILPLPMTSFRPDVMRVTERSSAGAKWYEVEIYTPGMHKWVNQKTHTTESAAIKDAVDWYPHPGMQTQPDAVMSDEDESLCLDMLNEILASADDAMDAAEARHEANLIDIPEQRYYDETVAQKNKAAAMTGTRFVSLIDIGVMSPEGRGVISHAGSVGEIVLLENGGRAGDYDFKIAKTGDLGCLSEGELHDRKIVCLIAKDQTPLESLTKAYTSLLIAVTPTEFLTEAGSCGLSKNDFTIANRLAIAIDFLTTTPIERGFDDFGD